LQLLKGPVGSLVNGLNIVGELEVLDTSDGLFRESKISPNSAVRYLPTLTPKTFRATWGWTAAFKATC
jgi:hypothetical protein